MDEGSAYSRKRHIKKGEKAYIKEKRLSHSDRTLRLERDKLYFEGYSKVDIHQQMIGDTVRTEAYKEAIFESVAGRVVIDVGAGTGILSIFAAEAGAKYVYAIEASDIVKVCRDQVRSKGLSSKIEIIHAKAEEVPWLQKTADVIVSEWIGYFLLFERMLPSVLATRDTHLKKDGIMIPRRSKMMIAGV